MAEIKWTAEAAQRLKGLHDYIAEDNPNTAGRVVESIYQKAQSSQILRLPKQGMGMVLRALAIMAVL